jgi:hypothetical protein
MDLTEEVNNILVLMSFQVVDGSKVILIDQLDI